MAGDLTRKQKEKGKHPDTVKLSKELKHYESLAPHDANAKKKAEQLRRELAKKTIY